MTCIIKVELCFNTNTHQIICRLILKPPVYFGLSQGVGGWGIHREMVISLRLSSRCHTDQPPNYPGGKRRSRVWGVGGWIGRGSSSAASTRPPKAMELAVCSTIKILIDNLLQWLVTASQLQSNGRPRKTPQNIVPPSET